MCTDPPGIVIMVIADHDLSMDHDLYGDIELEG